MIMEISFPNHLGAAAADSGHMTPRTLKRELKKLHRKDIPILLAHMKPQYLKVLKNEVRQLGLANLSFLRPGQRYRF